MRAIVATGYGPPDVLQLTEVAEPIPRAHELLVRVRASTVVAGDVRIRSSTYTRFGLLMRLGLGVRRPRKVIPGNEFSGVVEAVGPEVTRFDVGDQVFGVLWGIAFAGANAEYLCVADDGMVALRPNGVGHREAAAMPVGALCALHFLRRSGIREGQRILVHGASGSVGTYAVQLARHFGADVTAVCGPDSVDLVAGLGADRVIDYTEQDYTSIDDTSIDNTYDIVFDAAMKTSLREAGQVLEPGGVYLTLDWPIREVLRGLFDRNVSVVVGMARKNPEDLRYLTELLGDGTIRPVIDRCYPLEDTADAHRYVDTGHKHGNVVIDVAP
jgi:NADPH:quinone reductase-like Zn-dependent oxidoreductase